MQGRIQDRADIGIVTFMAYPIIKGSGPVEQSLSQLADDDYFGLLEITHISDAAVRKTCQDKLLQKCKKTAFGAQPTLLLNNLNLNHFDDNERAKAILAVKENIDEAYSWRSSGLAVLSGTDPGKDSRKKAIQLLADSLKQLCEYSSSKGNMPIILETFDRVNFGKNRLIGPSDETAELVKMVIDDYPAFGVMVDLSHLPLLNESPRYCLKILGPYVKHIHVGNCIMRDSNHEAYGDCHPRFGIPEGENGLPELTEFLKILKAIGYFSGNKKPLSFEIKPCKGESSEEIINQSKELLDQAWSAV